MASPWWSHERGLVLHQHRIRPTSATATSAGARRSIPGHDHHEPERSSPPAMIPSQTRLQAARSNSIGRSRGSLRRQCSGPESLGCSASGDSWAVSGCCPIRGGAVTEGLGRLMVGKFGGP